jgi:hypothetical protein
LNADVQTIPRYWLILIDFWCFSATFNNISAISWLPVLVVEEAYLPSTITLEMNKIIQYLGGSCPAL